MDYIGLKFQSHIYKPSERNVFLEERWSLLGWLAFLLFVLFLILEVYWAAFTIVFLLGLVCYGLAFYRWNTLEKPKGSFPFSLTICLDKIEIGGVVYPFAELKITKLVCDDYKGRSTIRHVFFAQYPMRSNGTWNHLWFSHMQKEYRLRFLIESPRHAQQLMNIKAELGTTGVR